MAANVEVALAEELNCLSATGSLAEEEPEVRSTLRGANTGEADAQRSQLNLKASAANLQRGFYVLVSRRKNCHESDNCVSYANGGLEARLQCAAWSRRVIGCRPRMNPSILHLGIIPGREPLL